jgi:hypothetical protein
MNAKLSWGRLFLVFGVVVLFAVTMLSAAAVPGQTDSHPSGTSPRFASSVPVDVSKSGATLPLAHKGCPTTTQCTYVADEIGGVQVFSGTSLIASIGVVLTPADPKSCPEFAYAWFGSILVSDQCGNNGLGELRVLNPATDAWGTPITIAGGGPTGMVGDASNGWLYVANSEYGSVTVLSSMSSVAGTVATCGSYPLFLDYDSASKIVFVGNQGFLSAACVDMIHGTTAGTPIVSAGTYTFSVSDEITGVTVNQHTGNVYIVDQSYSSYVGGVFEYGKRGTYKATILAPNGSDTVFGSTYDASTLSVYVVSNAQDNLGVFNATGFIFSINSTNKVGHPIFAGLGPLADCYNPASLSVYVPDNGDVTGIGVTAVKGSTVTQISIYGPVRGYGCGAN